MTATPRPLLDVLGARWRVGVAANGVAWDSRRGIAGFALGDGTLALAPATWDGAPTLRPREAGGAELVAGTAAAPPVARVPMHQGPVVAVAADPDAGFLTAGADGQIARLLADGELRAIGRLDPPVAALATGRAGWRVCASGRKAHRLGASAATIEVSGTVASLAVHPAGARVAIGHEGGVTLWSGGNAPRVLPVQGSARDVAWTRDGKSLACATGTALHAWRLPDPTPSTLHEPVEAMAPAGSSFAAATTGRVIQWQPGGDNPAPCGVASQSAVTRVACHPGRTVIAAGYANGTVVLCQPNTQALLFVRATGEGAVTALRFAPGGGHLAIATGGGEIAVLALPEILFRDTPGPQ